jgi:hypothetical protein
MHARFVVAAILLALAAGAGYWFMRPYVEAPPPPPAPAAKGPPEKKEPQFPVGTDAKPLPKLGESDAALRESLTGFVDPQVLGKFFNLQDGIRRIVATVDNLSREHLARTVNIAQPIGGAFVVSGKDDKLAIHPKNYARYDAFVRMAEAVDTEKAVSTYVYFYPLFQQAFVELGYPDGYFNDRLVEVIDHLLESPEPHGTVKLVTPHVLYEFDDPDLERLSCGQKIMIRVGPENESRLKAKLKQVRAAVMAASKPAPR